MSTDAASRSSTGSYTRATPFYCPYCAEEDLRPVEEPHGAWRCYGCTRVFVVKFVGLTAGGTADATADATTGATTGAAAGSAS